MSNTQKQYILLKHNIEYISTVDGYLFAAMWGHSAAHGFVQSWHNVTDWPAKKLYEWLGY